MDLLFFMYSNCIKILKLRLNYFQREKDSWKSFIFLFKKRRCNNSLRLFCEKVNEGRRRKIIVIYFSKFHRRSSGKGWN